MTHVTEMERRLEEARVLAQQLTAEQRRQLLALGDDLAQVWDHPRSPVTLKKRILRTVLQEVVANTTDDPPSLHLKPHWAGGSHAELSVPKNRTGYHNHIHSQEVTELIRELALVCEDGRLFRRNSNTCLLVSTNSGHAIRDVQRKDGIVFRPVYVHVPQPWNQVLA